MHIFRNLTISYNMTIVEWLPNKLSVIAKYLDKLEQLKICVDTPVKARVGGKNYFVGKNGLQNSDLTAIRLDSTEIDRLIKSACQNSIYAFENQIASGYLTLQDGTRIGISGKGAVGDGGKVYFSSYHSICVRRNKLVSNCSSAICDDLLFNNVIVCGLPGFGKTTYLRDLAIRASKSYDVVVLDERGELTQVSGGLKNSGCHILLNINRQHGVSLALQSLAPEIVVCDEIFARDVEWLKASFLSGVKVYATMHAPNFDTAFDFCSSNNLKFDFYLILQEFGGKKSKLYDKTGKYVTL